jgi:hypothetical protein
MFVQPWKSKNLPVPRVSVFSRKWDIASMGSKRRLRHTQSPEATAESSPAFIRSGAFFAPERINAGFGRQTED